MKQLLILALLLLIGTVLGLPAQEAAPAGFELWTAASLKGTIQAITPAASADPHHVATRQLADYPSDLFMLAHRAGDGQVEWHETQADVFFVQSGSATLIVGGKLINAETVAPHEKRNGTIEGGVRRKLSPGDVVRIPAQVPHQIVLDGAPEFDYFVIKIKGY
jgi:mannose-6-phosphate isomerase-like protein (cupin superfamily)